MLVMPRFRSRGAAVAAAAGAALVYCGGCYRYQPVSTLAPAPGREIQVRLTDAGTASLGRLLGAGAVEVEGRLVGASDREVTLAVQSVELRDGTETYWQGERVTIDRAGIAEISERAFSRPRSLLMGGALVAAALTAAVANFCAPAMKVLRSMPPWT
jgi:hypothetical protein